MISVKLIFVTLKSHEVRYLLYKGFFYIEPENEISNFKFNDGNLDSLIKSTSQIIQYLKEQIIKTPSLKNFHVLGIENIYKCDINRLDSIDCEKLFQAICATENFYVNKLLLDLMSELLKGGINTDFSVLNKFEALAEVIGQNVLSHLNNRLLAGLRS